MLWSLEVFFESSLGMRLWSDLSLPLCDLVSRGGTGCGHARLSVTIQAVYILNIKVILNYLIQLLRPMHAWISYVIVTSRELKNLTSYILLWRLKCFYWHPESPSKDKQENVFSWKLRICTYVHVYYGGIKSHSSQWIGNDTLCV